LSEKFLGCLFGLAVGDALGCTLEFKQPGTFEPITTIEGGGAHQLKLGQWTDDTSLALCLAQSLIDCNDFDPKDQMKKYCKWEAEGYMSSTGTCFDIGNSTLKALEEFRATGNPYAGSTEEHSAGNGSIMRLAPISMYYVNNPKDALRYAALSSKTTHANVMCVDSCRYMAGIIVGLLRGESKKRVLSSMYSPVPNYFDDNPLCNAINEIASGSFKKKQPPEIKGTGFVVQSLEAALWAFYKTDNFKEGTLKAVNLGDDADTTGSVYGQIAGAYYGIDNIPKEWIDVLAFRELILNILHRLLLNSHNNLTN
jgi:ADP-ribosylglycohydrolase